MNARRRPTLAMLVNSCVICVASAAGAVGLILRILATERADAAIGMGFGVLFLVLLGVLQFCVICFGSESAELIATAILTLGLVVIAIVTVIVLIAAALAGGLGALLIPFLVFTAAYLFACITLNVEWRRRANAAE